MRCCGFLLSRPVVGLPSRAQPRDIVTARPPAPLLPLPQCAFLASTTVSSAELVSPYSPRKATQRKEKTDKKTK